MEDWKKKIEDSAKDLEVPESLRPERVEETIGRKKKVLPFYRRPAVKKAAAAAAVVILILAGVQGLRLARELNGYGAASGMAMDTTESTAETSSDAAAPSEESSKDEDGQWSYDMDAGEEEASQQASSSGTGSSAESDEEEPDESFGAYYHTFTYEELKGELEQAWETWNFSMRFGNEAAAADGSATGSSADAGTAVSEEGGASGASADPGEAVSATNLQVEGVDEGDVVKTDGTYLYILSLQSGIRIVKAEGLELVSRIPMELDGGNIEYKEMFVDSGQLILVGEQYESSITETSDDVYYMSSSNRTVMVSYDLSDIENPEMTGKISQDGAYRTSRKVGDYLYLFSDYDYYADEVFDSDLAIPRVNGAAVPEDQIYVPYEIRDCRYLVMSAVNIKDPNTIIDQKALLNSGDEFHITQSSIYVIRYEGYKAEQEYSSFIRFRMNKGKIRAVAAASLKGELTDTFAVSESGGYLRTCLTDWSSISGSGIINRVYVLDANMNICGMIDNLAPGETIYSARFMGDRGYFVTYENTDPLFSVDFSDPENPEIVGELKVTGFSEYLHFYGDGKLFGLGWETDPNTGQTLGLKLSMYDIRNPEAVTEENKLVVKDADQCSALYNYKAILVDTEKNLIGFTLGFYDANEYHEKYVLFSYDQTEGFVKKLEFDLSGVDYYYSYDTTRGVYIGDVLYVAEQNRITAFDMKNKFEQLGSLELAEKR